jgi:hypothetical protein
MDSKEPPEKAPDEKLQKLVPEHQRQLVLDRIIDLANEMGLKNLKQILSGKTEILRMALARSTSVKTARKTIDAEIKSLTRQCQQPNSYAYCRLYYGMKLVIFMQVYLPHMLCPTALGGLKAGMLTPPLFGGTCAPYPALQNLDSGNTSKAELSSLEKLKSETRGASSTVPKIFQLKRPRCSDEAAPPG